MFNSVIVELSDNQIAKLFNRKSKIVIRSLKLRIENLTS